MLEEYYYVLDSCPLGLWLSGAGFLFVIIGAFLLRLNIISKGFKMFYFKTDMKPFYITWISVAAIWTIFTFFFI
jgi:hypothetical protein